MDVNEYQKKVQKVLLTIAMISVISAPAVFAAIETIATNQYFSFKVGFQTPERPATYRNVSYTHQSVQCNQQNAIYSVQLAVNDGLFGLFTWKNPILSCNGNYTGPGGYTFTNVNAAGKKFKFSLDTSNNYIGSERQAISGYASYYSQD